MPEKMMMAAVYHGPRKLSVESVPVPEIGPSDVLIKVHGCGICGSDLHSYKAGMYIRPGQIMGHEFMGAVAAAGDLVEGIDEGDRVTGFGIGVCGTCYWCARQQYILCPELFRNSTGYGLPGGFAEYVPIRNAVVGQSIHLVPDELDDETAATTEPVSVGVGATDAAGVRPGDRVVVLGAGMIGNACMQAAKAAGAEQVAVVDISPVRLEAARRLGADEVFDARTGDALSWVKELWGVGRYHFNEGGMADVVIEAAGAPVTIQQAFEMVRSGGTIVFVGLPEEPAPLDVTKIVHKQPRIVGSLGGDFARALELLAGGRIRTKELITHRFPLERASEAFETQLRTDEAMKVMIQPREE
ncbi:Sorbitol dehydrogenase [Rubrobacter xylanophilus DSM 9941]|uniref:zinc-dependent alcohol dehydrogenase n=1 Tax=Rubrobacter xylanophilus TaxID=49319 RepID=UPI001C64449B|nr:zinc-binding dehydrogenase [Rubrobacter xylanophilus]QYJ16600.1 Sorbitol dehydrogenase [Rubrobacter xylanophilus DSM 9941]